MNELFFHAVAGNPKVAPALMRQTESTLGPFSRYLRQAKQTARQRQSRYQLPWERTGDQQVLRLTPLDHQLWIPARPPSWRIADWPAHLEPDTRQQLIVVSPRSLMLDVLSCRRDADGLLLQIDGDVAADDRVFWGGHECSVTPESLSAAPSSVCDSAGKTFALRSPPEREEDGWVLVVEGQARTNGLVVDGEPVQPRPLPWQRGLRRLRDAAGRSLEYAGDDLKVDELPAQGLLAGDNGMRFEWAGGKGKGKGAAHWVRLLLPDSDKPDEFLDPRAAFCEGEVKEVWTRPRYDPSGHAVFKVKRVDSDRYQLRLDRLPPEGTSLFLPINTHNVEGQQRAVRQLQEAPLPHHAGLLRLCEDPGKVRWPVFDPIAPQSWTELRDETRSGTDEQRSFVRKALGSPDIAMLEGPPGSGKTTAICELIQQLIAEGQRVLLCASTHVAIDNALERLIEAGAPVDAVRVGPVDRVDENVQATQIDGKVDALVEAWRGAPHLNAAGDDALKEMATRTVIASANLTCGTTTGIVQHPLFRDRGRGDRPWETPITTMPHWDVLIIDEASKTLTQEFLVPALMAKRCVIVGDVRQLPPFADRDEILANLRSLTDDKGRRLLSLEHQRARLLLFRINSHQLRATDSRWLIVERPGVLDRLVDEMRTDHDLGRSVVRVVAKLGQHPPPCAELSIEQLRAGHAAALRLLTCDWVLVPYDVLPEVADQLPSDLLHHRELARGERGLPESHPLLFRHAWWLQRAGGLARPYGKRRDQITTPAQSEKHEQRWLEEHDLASEIAWRLVRIHELKHSRDQRDRQRYQRDLERLLPAAVDISESIGEIEDIGLPSVLEVLQEGIGTTRTPRPSALTEGMPGRTPTAFDARFGRLSYQHRMHPEISEFPRTVIYTGEALLDANTIADRDSQLGWDFGPFRRRRVWITEHGREIRGVNKEEVRVAEGIIRGFLAWADSAGPPRRRSGLWEVACLCFYVKQEEALSDMLKRVTGQQRRTRFRAGDVEIVCGTVDRFQGREADLVVLSMRNTSRVGFLDSRNRLNVAVTRARQQLIVVGNARNFADCWVSELKDLVELSPLEDARRWTKRS